MNIYLCARYGRRREMAEFARDVEALGHCVVSTWIQGEHESIDLTASNEERRDWAMADISEIQEADTLVCFTELPGSPYARGGRHVEFGYWLGLAHATYVPEGESLPAVYVVGPRENVFHCLPEVVQFDTPEECLAHLAQKMVVA